MRTHRGIEIWVAQISIDSVRAERECTLRRSHSTSVCSVCICVRDIIVRLKCALVFDVRKPLISILLQVLGECVIRAFARFCAIWPRNGLEQFDYTDLGAHL